MLEKGNKIVEKSEPSVSSLENREYKTAISYDNNSIRNKLIDIMERGLLLKSIAVNAGISESELSRFKNGVDDALKELDKKLLADYLNVVYIPRWNNGEKLKTKKVESTRDWLFM